MSELSKLSPASAGFVIPETEFAFKVVSEYPALATVGTDWERVDILRKWAWSHVAYTPNNDVYPAPFPERLDEPGPQPGRPRGWKQQTASEIFEKFERGDGGVLCGSCSFAMAALCRYFGFRAWDFGNGDNNNRISGHAQTLVEIVHRGQTIVVLQDASFNLSYVDLATKEPLDYFEILKRLVRREHLSIRVVETDWRQMARWPQAHFPAALVNGRTAEEVQRDTYCVLDYCFTVETKQNGNLVFSSPRTLGKFVRTRCFDSVNAKPLWFLQSVIDRGYPPDLLYQHLHLSHIDGPDREEMRSKIEVVSRSDSASSNQNA